MLIRYGHTCASRQAAPVCDARSVSYALARRCLAFFGNGKNVTNAVHFAPVCGVLMFRQASCPNRRNQLARECSLRQKDSGLRPAIFSLGTLHSPSLEM